MREDVNQTLFYSQILPIDAARPANSRNNSDFENDPIVFSGTLMAKQG